MFDGITSAAEYFLIMSSSDSFFSTKTIIEETTLPSISFFPTPVPMMFGVSSNLSWFASFTFNATKSAMIFPFAVKWITINTPEAKLT